MDFEAYREMDATAMAAAVVRGKTTPVELLECAIARADSVNPMLNAIVGRRDAAARGRAQREPAGPLAGVPFLTKDLHQEIEGEPYAWGCRALKEAGVRADAHTEIVRRWLAAGLVPFGRTNTPELGGKGLTEPEAFGPARNPWNPEHTPGGSSGGAAVAVAAGIVPVAGANDGGGSIRIPASSCGLFGLKPGRRRMWVGSTCAELSQGTSVNHVVSRSVRDSAAVLDATYALQPPVPDSGAAAERSWTAAVTAPPAPLRIAFSTRSPIGTPVHAECRKAVEDAARLLESLGHRVEETEPALDGAQLARDWLALWVAHVAATVDRIKALTGAGGAGFEVDTRAMAALGHVQSAAAYVKARERRGSYQRAMRDFHQRYDLYMTPTVARPPPRIGEMATPGWQRAVLRGVLTLRAMRVLTLTGMVDSMLQDNLCWIPFTQLANLTGAPAMSVPLHWTGEGLPVGVQFNAPEGGEGALLSLAGQLEQAQPWFHRVPGETGV